jgi:CubicO group peptidase (beta-lactamase class C family)
MGTIGRRILRVFVGFAVFLLVLTGFGVGWFFWGIAPIGSAYTAKRVCSEVFVAGRDPEEIFAVDVLADNNPLLPLTSYEVDREQKRISATLLGTNERVAVYRDHLGCTLALGVEADELQAITAPDQAPVAPVEDGFSRVHDLPPGTNAALIEEALEQAFAIEKARTRAVAVAYNGKLIAERYAPGFGPNVPMLGWSMTKSTMNALTGILVKRGLFELDDAVPIALWRVHENDARADITYRHLLQMSPSLNWSELYAYPRSDVVRMLYNVGDTAALAANKELSGTPGGEWSYSSGTTNLLSSALRAAMGNDAAAYWSLPREGLFRPLGMHTALIEPDAAGTFVGSSYMYASARDWLRFGELFRQDGVWNGARILPEGWVDFSIADAPAAPANLYGAQWWKRVFGSYTSDEALPVPDDLYIASGHEGQLLTIIPSEKLVIIRLGIARGGKWEHDQFVNRIVRALPND